MRKFLSIICALSLSVAFVMPAAASSDLPSETTDAINNAKETIEEGKSSLPSIMQGSTSGSTSSDTDSQSLDKETDIDTEAMEENLTDSLDGELGEGIAEADTSFTQHLADTYGIDADSFYQDLTSTLNSGEPISFSDLFKDNGCMFDYIDQSLYDINTVSGYDSVDFGYVNLEYQTLSSTLTSEYADTNLAGYSQGCVDLFNNTYGDIASQIQLDEPKIPDGFTVEAMMTSASNAVTSAYSDATSSGTFASVKQQISIGDVFSKASQDLSGYYSLASKDTLYGMVGVSGDDEMLEKYNRRVDNIDAKVSALSEEQTAKIVEQQKKYDEATIANQASSVLESGDAFWWQSGYDRTQDDNIDQSKYAGEAVPDDDPFYGNN